MKLSYLLMILTCAGAFSCGQAGKSLTDPSENSSEKSDAAILQNSEWDAHIHSEFSYPDADGNALTIQNSLNRGGPLYGDFKTHYSHSFLVFFMHIQNDRDVAFELSISLPPDSFPIPGSPHTYMKAFLPKHIMTQDQKTDKNYGITGLDAYLEHYTPTALTRSIPAHGECLFNTGTIFYQTRDSLEHLGRGGNRAEFFLEGENLFMRMLPQVDTIPCGRIVPRH